MNDEEDPAAWLRSQIEADLALARRVAARWIYPPSHRRAGEPIWPNASVKALPVFRRDDPDVRAGLDLITLCSPADVVADREADLAILDEHRPVIADPGYLEQGQSPGSRREYRIIWENPTADQIRDAPNMWHVLHCRTCRRPPACSTVRLMLGRYRFRPGYQKEWGLISG